MGVIETGLGGTRDATNVFGDQLQLAIITAVGTEHSAALGALRPEIHLLKLVTAEVDTSRTHHRHHAVGLSFCLSSMQLHLSR